ncbi:Maf family protein [Paenibacillus chartarius]|uniref:dTTP/UTP pyrophosphatase n=1 Tax=Paenibacillus chartarius TaxID=747481 RepID=A0ABV6DJ02_9BACL
MSDFKMIVLASSSPRRQELIRAFGLPFEVKVSNVDETTEPGLPPADIVESLALRKAEAVFQTLEPSRQNDSVVVGSDTIVVLEGEVLGKPRDEADAFRMLSGLQGRSHYVYTGLACIGKPFPELASIEESRIPMGTTGGYRVRGSGTVGHTVTKVTFRPLTEAEIRGYIRTGEPMDKAGAYGVQGIGSVMIERMEGDFYSVMGLPLNLLYMMLAVFGLHPLLSDR